MGNRQQRRLAIQITLAVLPWICGLFQDSPEQSRQLSTGKESRNRIEIRGISGTRSRASGLIATANNHSLTFDHFIANSGWPELDSR
jgi:hypothetical protein